jgi:hypothetical protein
MFSSPLSTVIAISFEAKQRVNEGRIPKAQPFPALLFTIVAEVKMERAKGFEPSTLTLAT